MGETDSPAVNMPSTQDRSQFGGDFCSARSVANALQTSE